MTNDAPDDALADLARRFIRARLDRMEEDLLGPEAAGAKPMTKEIANGHRP